MNKERILELAATLEKNEPIVLENGDAVVFDMDIWLQGKVVGENWCGSSGCIAGSALVKWLTLSELKGMTVDNMQDTAAELLDLDDDTASELFVPKFGTIYWRANGEQAARVLRNLVETGGKVDWTVSGCTIEREDDSNG